MQTIKHANGACFLTQDMPINNCLLVVYAPGNESVTACTRLFVFSPDCDI